MFLRSNTVFRAGVGLAFALLTHCCFAQAQVTTYHNDNLRTGLNSLETILTPGNVNPAKFGLLFSLPVDGQVYAQPLYLPRVYVPGRGTHNVLYVATEHNSVYAFDADSNTGANAKPLWHVNFGPSVPNGDTGTGDINPEIGITSTPVIHTIRTGLPLLYVVSKTKTLDNQGNPIYTQQLHAISVETGAEELHGPITISGQVPGTGDGSSGGIVAFNPLIQHTRPALLIVPTPGEDSTLYVAYASHGDNGPYHGWLFEFDADKLKPLGLMNTTPNALTDPSGYPLAAGGIWQGGGGLASDGKSVYFATGNGTFDPTTGAYGDSIIRIANKTFTVADFFTPAEQLSLDDSDADLGSGGVMLLPPTASGTSKKTFLVQSGKEGSIYLLDTSNLGQYNSTDNVHQELPQTIGGIWGAPAYFNKTVYFGPVYSPLVAFPIKNGLFTSTSPTASTVTQFQYPGPTPSISANGTSNGIVWAIQTDNYGSGGPAILHAYEAGNVANELYNSSETGGRDTLDGAVKFTTPTIVNGKVYAGCNSSVCVFGHGSWAATPKVTPSSGSFANSVKVTMTDSTPRAQIRYTTDGSTPTATSTLYTKPITLTTSATLSARAFLTGSGASAIVQNNYLISPVTGTGTGLFGGYYNNSQDASGTPTASEIDPTINFNWNGNSPITGVAGTNWAGEWTGQIQAMTTGTYTLTTNSDDGVELFINGQMIISDYTYHGPTYDSATIDFVAGQMYTIEIKYFQGGGGSLLQLFWAAPGLPMQIVPTTQLYPASGQG